MKKYSLFCLLLSALLFVSCRSSKKFAEDTASGENRKAFDVPCAEYTSNTSEAFRATASSISPNFQFAKDKALALARSALAQKIETSVNTVFDIYANQYDVNNKNDFSEITKTITSQETQKKLSNLSVTCEKSFTLSSGKYEVWVGLEMPIDNIGQSIHDQVSADDRIKMQFEYEKFKKELQSTMNK